LLRCMGLMYKTAVYTLVNGERCCDVHMELINFTY